MGQIICMQQINKGDLFILAEYIDDQVILWDRAKNEKIKKIRHEKFERGYCSLEMVTVRDETTYQYLLRVRTQIMLITFNTTYQELDISTFAKVNYSGE